MNLLEIMQNLSFDERDIDCILNADKLYGDKAKKLALKYFIGENTYQDGLDKIRAIDDKNVHEYTILMLYALLCAENLYKKYKEKGLSDKLFIDTVMDLKYKLDECRRVYDICGSFVPEWFRGIFDMDN